MADTRITSPGATMVAAALRFNGSTPETLVDAELAKGSPRSHEYRNGMLDVLNYRMRGVKIHVPHKEGTAAADAYFAGNVRGHALWRTLQAEATPTATQEACHV